MRVCCLTRRELMDYAKDRTLPDCANVNPDSNKSGHHLHKSYKEIERIVGPDDGSGMATWVGGRFMCFLQNPKKWQPVRGVLQLITGVIGGRNSGATSQFAKSSGKGFKYPVPGGGGGRPVYEFTL